MLAGLLAFVTGSVLVSQFFTQSLYNVYSGWKVDSPPESWQRACDRYFRLDVIRGRGPGVAFVLFWTACPLPSQRRCSNAHHSDGE